MEKLTSHTILTEIAQKLLESLDARSKDVMQRRYGLVTGRLETLESIGKEYGVTRERVRQIQSQAKKVLLDLSALTEPVNQILMQVFSTYGGILAEEHVVAAIREHLRDDSVPATHVAFYLDLLPAYTYVIRDAHFAPHWRYEEVVTPQAQKIVAAATAVLEHAQHPLTQGELLPQVQKELRNTAAEVPAAHVEALLSASKDIQKTPFGEWGLATWAETRPRGVGDKAYAVLRRHGKPEHFTRIADLINDSKFDFKRANPQTVHNELIKDKRFVLVGRGLYGLAEWGFIPGTVADVIQSLLEKAGHALTRDEIIEQVLAQRQVKKNTIVLGLQNQSRFQKTAENKYGLRSR
jgi:hypothetical protein